MNRFVFFILGSMCLCQLAYLAETQTEGNAATVSIPFFANGDHDKPIREIALADISLLDAKTPPKQILAIINRDDLPLRLGILIDQSNSQRNNELYQAALSGVSDFANDMLHGPKDRLFIETFDVEPSATDFLDKSQLSGLKVDARPQGGTALFKAIRYACEERMSNDQVASSARAILLLSDGDDNMENVSRDEAIASAQKARVVIFSVSTADDRSAKTSRQGDSNLKHLADATGGLSFLQLGKKDIAKALSIIRDQIDNVHMLTFVPNQPTQTGTRRSIELKLNSTPKAKVRSSASYMSQ
jgi:Ca-activated chloride channel homolog